MWVITAGIFLGWALGANDAANVFGPAVSSNILKFWKAAFLAASFIVLGALLEGRAGIDTVAALTDQTTIQAFICMLSAALVVTIMTILKLPVSTSQAVIGSVIGSAISGSGLNMSGFQKVIICWIGTPVGAAVIAYILFMLISRLMQRIRINFFEIDLLLRWGLIFCTVYGAYALGANNVANTTGVFVKAKILSPNAALWIGAVSIAVGVLTYSKNVIRTVGKGVVKLDGFSSFITLLASAMTVHFYAIVGVPVSTSQAIIGAVLGIGIIKGFYVINVKTLLRIFSGWLMTPTLAVLLAALLTGIFG